MSAVSHRAGLLFELPRLLLAFRARHAAHAQSLEPESLPDYLKRDLGLLGGRTAPRRDPLRD